MLANYECDLHGHTNRSDGNDSPVEYIRHAVHRGVKILAITDHDIVPPEMIELGGGKRQEITAYAKGIGVELLRGIEISCETYIDDVHLVCFGCDWNAPYFKELDEFTINSKVNSYRKLIDLLNEQGMEMTWEEVLQNNGYPVQEQFVQKKREIKVKIWDEIFVQYISLPRFHLQFYEIPALISDNVRYSSLLTHLLVVRRTLFAHL